MHVMTPCSPASAGGSADSGSKLLAMHVLFDAIKLLPLLSVADGCCPSIIIETMYRVNVISAVNQTF
jgi:hypothetical protein